MLLLFDIDGTLLSTSGAGLVALQHAVHETLDPALTIEGISFAGRLDPLIIGDLLRKAGRDVTADGVARVRAGYERHLPAVLEAKRAEARSLPGVPELLHALAPLAARGDVTLGLVTGNFPTTGAMKLRACGLRLDDFTANAWGDDSPSLPPTRDDLPRVAMQRFEHATGRRAAAHRTVVIGDTPLDVRCAKANGCRSLAVATGFHSRHELAASGADRAVDSLADTNDVLRWLIGAV